MFDFQSLDVYKKARAIHRKVHFFILDHPKLPFKFKDQLYRASMSVVLNIAEGSGRSTTEDKRHYFVQSRGSVFETVACLEISKDYGELSEMDLNGFTSELETLSKMLFGLIR